MVPVIVLVVSALLFWLTGRVGVAVFRDLGLVLRAALGMMFLFTASAHWGKRRPDLIRMVPPALPRPDLLVTFTGVLEIAGSNWFVPTNHRAGSMHLLGAPAIGFVPREHSRGAPQLGDRRTACT
jgi:hypothetical protein